jgi:hypothetical protein
MLIVSPPIGLGLHLKLAFVQRKLRRKQVNAPRQHIMQGESTSTL